MSADYLSVVASQAGFEAPALRPRFRGRFEGRAQPSPLAVEDPPDEAFESGAPRVRHVGRADAPRVAVVDDTTPRMPASAELASPAPSSIAGTRVPEEAELEQVVSVTVDQAVPFDTPAHAKAVQPRRAAPVPETARVDALAEPVVLAVPTVSPPSPVAPMPMPRHGERRAVIAPSEPGAVAVTAVASQPAPQRDGSVPSLDVVSMIVPPQHDPDEVTSAVSPARPTPPRSDAGRGKSQPRGGLATMRSHEIAPQVRSSASMAAPQSGQSVARRDRSAAQDRIAPHLAVHDQHRESTTVQITIGRIEVRAAPAPAPRRAERPAPPPVMPLAQFLDDPRSRR